jgi:hypothetical protein
LLQASQQCECTWKLDDEVSRLLGQPGLEQTRSVWLGKGPRGKGASWGAALLEATACKVALGLTGEDGCPSHRSAGPWRVALRPPACPADLDDRRLRDWARAVSTGAAERLLESE